MYSVLTLTASLCAGITATCLSLAFFQMLLRLQADRSEEGTLENFKAVPMLLRLGLPLAPYLLPLIKKPLFDNSRAHLDPLLLSAGYDQSLNANQFLACRFVLGGTGLVFIVLAVALKQPLLGIILFLLLVCYPTLWLRSTIKRRHVQIQKALPTVLDLLTLSIEAGRDFLTALRDISSRRRSDALNEELGRTLREIQLGKPRRKALKEMADRVQQSDLTSVINAIIQADELGVSIGQLLRIQGDQLRSKRFQRAEKMANEAPVKILFPVVIFIFPSVIIILMAPIIMQAFKTMFR